MFLLNKFVSQYNTKSYIYVNYHDATVLFRQCYICIAVGLRVGSITELVMSPVGHW